MAPKRTPLLSHQKLRFASVFDRCFHAASEVFGSVSRHFEARKVRKREAQGTKVHGLSATGRW